MRIRYMKPGFFKNEDLSAFSPMHRLCFAGLWLLADKAGRLEDRPRRIKAELFAYENADVEDMLNDLTAGGFLKRYVVGDVPVIQIINFAKHQRTHKDEPVSQLPECVDSTQSYVDSPMQPANLVRELVTENGERRTDVGAGKAPTPARDFLAWFVDEYKRLRHGAKYRVLEKHGGIVKGLLSVHQPDRLRNLATIMLTSNEEWIESTDRGIEVFAAKLNWLEDRLAAWEKRRQA